MTGRPRHRVLLRLGALRLGAFRPGAFRLGAFRPGARRPGARRPGALRLGAFRLTILLPAAVLLAAACGSDTNDGLATAGAVTSTVDTTVASDTTNPAESADPSDTAAETTATTDPGGDTTGSSAPSPSGSTTAPPVPTTAPVEELALAVGAEGFEIVDGGSIRRLPFGTPRDQVETALTNLLGFPPESSPGSPDCGNGPDEVLVWPGEVLVDIRDGGAISWFLRDGSSLTTIAGIGLGSSRSQVEDAYVIEVSDGSIGIEFTTGSGGTGVAGLLSGPGANATVTELWAGEVCIFR